MRKLLPVLLLSALIAPVASSMDKPSPAAKPEPPRRVVLKGADCLDPASARSWQYVDDNELLVDAGRRKYRIRLSEFCSDLGQSSSIGFRGDSGGRICGHPGERVVPHRPFGTRQMECRIDRVELIDAQTYRDAGNRRRGKVAASQDAR